MAETVVDLLQSLDHIPNNTKVLDILANTRVTGRLGAYTCYKLVHAPELYEDVLSLNLNVAVFATRLLQYAKVAYNLDITIPELDDKSTDDKLQDVYNENIRLLQKQLEVFYG